jgi:hypothetical protein
MLHNVDMQQLKVLQGEYKSQQKQISKRLTQLKNRYLLESYLGFDCKCSREGARLQMTRLTIAMVKMLKSCLGIVRTSTYFHCTQHFRKIIMTSSIKRTTLSAPSYN